MSNKMGILQLVIGNKNYSSSSLRAWLILAKLGIEFQEIRVPLCTEGYQGEAVGIKYIALRQRVRT